MTMGPLTDQAKALVEDNLPLVRQVLAGVAAHYPRHADREELAQAAALGLVEAAARYDAARGVPFDRWAGRRIRGAILDAVRALDFAPRTLRAAARDADVARTTLESILGRTPSRDEVAAYLGVPAPQLAHLEGRVHRSLVLSLDAPCGGQEGLSFTLSSELVDEVQLQPVDVLEHRERSTYLRDALDCLPDRLKDVVVGYFLDGQSSGDLARRLGVTESRVSQLRTEALTLLRAGLEAQYDDPPPLVDSGACKEAGKEAGKAAHRQAAFAVELASRSTYANRLSLVPQQPGPVEDRVEVRAAG